MMNSARIKKIIYDETSTRPLIGNFQNGVIQPKKEDKLSCAVFKDKTSQTNVVVASEKGYYTDIIRRDEDCYNNFVLVRNKKKGTCKLIAVDKVTFDFALDAKPQPANEDALHQSENKRSMAKELIKQFGSKKQKKLHEQQEKTSLDVETMKNEYQQVADEMQIDKKDLEPQNSDHTETSYKPRINKAAIREEEVYPIESVVSEVILAELEEEAEHFLNPENDLSSISAEFVKKQLQKLQKSSLTERTLKAKIFIYIEYLIKFIKVPAKNISSKKYRPCDYSQKLSEYIFEHFSLTTSTGRTRPISMRDKCICYILVLAMIGCNLTLDIELLSKDLKVGVKRLQELSRVLYFTTNAKEKGIVDLKLPLPPPVLSASPNKRGRRN